jgi:hypothetical protein
MRVKGSTSSAAFAAKFFPYLLVLCARAVLVTSSVPIVLRVRNRGFWKQYRRQNLWRDRAQGGRIMCVQQDCEALYAESALVRVLPDALFWKYRAAQDAVVEQRLFEGLQQRFQEQLEAARRGFENANNVGRAEQGAAANSMYMYNNDVGKNL